MVVLALLAVLIAPHFIDWGAYRADFEREASRILGQTVIVRGDASAQLLPFPSVVFSDVEVQGDEPGSPLVTARHFRMDAELAPYLSGEIRIFSMRVDDPVLHLSVGADGHLGFVPKGGSLPVDATVVLEDVTITNGTILVDDAAAGRAVRIERIGARFSAKSLAGPVAGGGTLEAGGRPLDFLLSSGSPDGGGELPLKLTLDDRGIGVTATVDGLATLAGGAPRFEGAIRAATLVEPPAPAPATGPPPAPAAASTPLLPVFSAAGKFAAGPRNLDLSDLRLSVGGGEKPYILTGAGALDGGPDPSFSLVLDGEQVDIDALAAGDGDPATDVTFDRRLEAARQVLSRIPRPAIPGSATLNLPIVIAGDTTVRDLSIVAAPSGGAWAIQRFAAELPGRTRMEAAGSLELDRDALGFRGSLLVAARQPSGFSEWLTGAVDPAIRTLGEAGFSATVDLSPERQSFRDLEVDIGGDTLTGSLERTGQDGAREIKAELRGGRLDLDAFIALSRLFTGEADSIADARHGSLKVEAGPVVYAGATAGEVDASLSYDGRTLVIDHAEIRDLAGSDITAKGSLADLDRDVSGSVEVTMGSKDPAALFEFMSQRLPPSPALAALRERAPTLAPLALTGVLHTSPGAPAERPTLDVQISGKAAGTDVSLSMLLGNGIYAGGSAGRFGLNLSMANGEPSQLLGQFGIEALPVPVPSPLSLHLSLSADATGPVAASAAVRAPGSELTAEGTLGIAATGVNAAEIGLSMKSDDLSPWLLATGNTYGAPGLDGLPATFAGTIGYDGATLVLNEADGSLGTSDFSMDLERPADGPVTGSVFLSSVSVPWLAGLVYGRPPVDPARPGQWSKASFGGTLQTLPPFALDLTADELSLGGTASVGQASARIEGKPGEITLSDLRGVFGGGYGTATMQFRNADGVGAFSARADLQGLDLGALALTGFALPNEDGSGEQAGGGSPPGVSGTLDATLRLDASGQSTAGLVSAMTGAGSVHVEDAAFAGLRPGMLPEILRAADAPGFDTAQSRVSALLTRIAGDGRYPVPSASTEFSVIGGVAQFPALHIERPGESLAAEGALDLASARVSGSVRLDLDPGDEAVEGAAPAVDYSLSGPLASPLLTAGVQPLANFLAVRALEREQARVEAIQSALQEKLRLRREVRLYRWREDQRLAAEETSATRERIILMRAQEAERQKADAARRAQEERLRAIERERAAAREEAVPSAPDFTVPIRPQAAPPAPSPDSSNLPGVRNPFGLQDAPGAGG